MDKQKKPVNFFERIEVTDPDYAQKVYDKESSRFKLKQICMCLALVASICGLVMVSVHDIAPFLISSMGFLWLLGFIATIIAGSLANYLKIVFKFGQAAYYHIPFIFVDIVCFILGATIGLMVCLMFPVIPCVITLYQSYQNLKGAKEYLALYHQESTQIQSLQVKLLCTCNIHFLLSTLPQLFRT